MFPPLPFLAIDMLNLIKFMNKLQLIKKTIKIVNKKGKNLRIFLKYATLINARLLFRDQSFQLQLQNQINSLLLLVGKWIGSRYFLYHIVVLTDDYWDLVLFCTVGMR